MRVVPGAPRPWSEIFKKNGRDYPEPQLVLFTGAVQSGCGLAQSAMGPFYCPRDQRVYIDLDFYRQLRDRFGAPGDFAQAYVIAHEVGHHVQTVLGVSDQVSGRSNSPDAAAQRASFMELQRTASRRMANHAYTRAKGWSRVHEEALNAASAIATTVRSPAGRYPGELHPRVVRPAHGLVQARLRVRRSQHLRHVPAELVIFSLDTLGRLSYIRESMHRMTTPAFLTVSGRRPSLAPMAMRTRRGPLSP